MEYRLRNWEITDLESIIKHVNNFNVIRYQKDAFPHPYTIEDGIRWIEPVLNDNPVKSFAIEINGEIVGDIGITPQSDVYRKNAEIGYWLSEQYWGQGIMVRAVNEIVAYGFKTFDITRIYARVYSMNTQSQRVLQKSGFVEEATFKNTILKNGEYMDEIYYGIRRG